MTPKPLTPQGISALLGRAGFRRAVSRGTEGYAAGKVYQGDGAVRVRHYFPSMGAPDAQHRAELERYAGVITGAGYAAELQDSGRKLIVTAKREC